MRTHHLEHTTKERLVGSVTTPSDPTGGDVEFNMTSSALTSPSGSWTAGAYVGAWSSTSGKVAVRTPIIGEGDFTLTEGESYKLWVRVAYDDEQPVDQAFIIKAR